MTPDANLSCVRADCGGEYRHVGTNGDVDRFECQACGDEIEQELGPVLGEWARALADGGSGE